MPLKPDGFSLFWVELLTAVDDRSVVVVTEVAGNPGRSVVNAVERVSAWLSDELGLPTGSRWVTAVEPALDFLDLEEVVEALLADDFSLLEWRHMPRQQFETELRTRSTPLPRDLLARVMAAGGRTEEKEQQPSYRVIDVGDLPLPGDLFRCRYVDRFRAARAGLPEEAPEGAIRFYEGLTQKETARCRYHQADWALIAHYAVHIIETLGPQPDEAALTHAIEAAGLAGSEHDFLRSLFGADAIALSSDRTYDNGQHRACALRLSGASLAVVVAD